MWLTFKDAFRFLYTEEISANKLLASKTAW